VWARFKVGGLKMVWYAYLYTDEDGYPILVSARDLKEARDLRDVRLEQTHRRVPPVGSVKEEQVGSVKPKPAPKPEPASDCSESRCNSIDSPTYLKALANNMANAVAGAPA